MVDESLLKKSLIKKSDSNLDDLSSIAFKCNFDLSFIEEVANKISFPIQEYLLMDDKEGWLVRY